MADLMKSGFLLIFKDHVILQSFDPGSLQKLSTLMAAARVGPAPLAWLVGCRAQGPPTDDELRRFAQYGQVIAPDKVGVALSATLNPKAHASLFVQGRGRSKTGTGPALDKRHARVMVPCDGWAHADRGGRGGLGRGHVL